MVGKFFLVAFFFVSLAQVQGNELEEAIKNGLNRVKGMYEGAQKKINGSIEGVRYKEKAIQKKSLEFGFKAVSVQDGAINALENVARAMEEKAKEMGKPESVFECIKQNKLNATNRIRDITNKFKSNLEKLEKTKLAELAQVSKPLKGMNEALTAKYQQVVQTIKNCKTTSCVDEAIKTCAKWLEQMNSDIEKIFSEIGRILESFAKEAGTSLNINNKSVNQVKVLGIRDIKNCVFGNAFLGKY